MKNSSNDYAIRIAQATSNELNIITFELCILNINEALEFINDNNKMFSFKLNNALLLLKEIIISLNFEYEIAKELSNIYLYVNKLLIESQFNHKEENLKDSVILLTTIKEGFEQIDDKDSKNVIQNASKVFAGLTYGRNGSLSEYVDNSAGTEFKA